MTKEPRLTKEEWKARDAILDAARGDWSKMSDKEQIVKLREVELLLKLMFDPEFKKKFLGKDRCPHGAMGS